MRKIEQQINDTIYNLCKGRASKGFSSGNTIVVNAGDRAKVFLHGNHIADVFLYTGILEVNVETLKCYPTNTTKSRLRALGAKVTTKKGITYLNGVAV